MDYTRRPKAREIIHLKSILMTENNLKPLFFNAYTKCATSRTVERGGNGRF